MMNEPVVHLGLWDMVLSGLMILVVLFGSIVLRLRMAGEISVAIVRSTVQLLAAGFIIGWVFERREWYFIVALLLVMTFIAGLTGASRTPFGVRRLGWLFTFVLGAVTAITLVYIAGAVIGERAWQPRYLIPLGGMLLGNAMTAGVLVVERLFADVRQSARDIEIYLALGASPGQAIHRFRCAAVRAALTPTINTMMLVGVVQLPGMMTGQMLGGSAPLQAALYQLLILFGIALVAMMTAVALAWLTSHACFTSAWQLDRSFLQRFI